jgi:hypothetical protein
MREMKGHRAGLLVWLIAAVMLLLAPAALAGDPRGQRETGEGRLVSKNEAQRTLELEDVTVQILTNTRIYNADARRISFRQIHEPDPRAPVIVEYEGKRRGNVIDASKVVVALQPH